MSFVPWPPWTAVSLRPHFLVLQNESWDLVLKLPFWSDVTYMTQPLGSLGSQCREPVEEVPSDRRVTAFWREGIRSLMLCGYPVVFKYF